MAFSGTVKIADLSDYIAPSQSCVVSLSGNRLNADTLSDVRGGLAPPFGVSRGSRRTRALLELDRGRRGAPGVGDIDAARARGWRVRSHAPLSVTAVCRDGGARE